MKVIVLILSIGLLISGLMGCTVNKSNSTTPITDNSNLTPVEDECVVIYRFSSIKDMNTYITTGSKNPEDYEGNINHKLDNLPPATLLRECGYHSVYEYFDFDTSLFNSVAASFSPDQDLGGYLYFYDLDDIRIVIKTVRDRNLSTTSKFFLNSQSNDTSQLKVVESDLIAYSSGMEFKDSGYALRKSGETEIIYKFENGVKRSACMLIGEIYVQIYLPIATSESNMAEGYMTFTTEKKYSPFAALFDDNDSAFNATVNQLKAASELKS